MKPFGPLVVWAARGSKQMAEEDMVNHPSHYTSGSIECIDAIEASMTAEAFKGYCKGNAMKYIWRYEKKGSVESLQKAIWYLNKLIEVESSDVGS
jgi:DNA transposition AAA+ family ATPase